MINNHYDSHPKRIQPGNGQESVWDYPRPPRLEPVFRHLQVIFSGIMIAETYQALRVLETSHPPVYYFPPGDVRMDVLAVSPFNAFCEFKGQARFFTVKVGLRQAPRAAWSYPNPLWPYHDLRGYLAFFARPMDVCLVDDEPVEPQPGDFYGGWITSGIVGPFKGGPGTLGW